MPTAAETKTAVSEFNRLVNVEKALAVITTRSQIALTLNPLSAARKIPLLATAGAEAFISGNPYAFRFFPTTELESRALAQKARSMGLKKMAFITARTSGIFRSQKASPRITPPRGSDRFSDTLPLIRWS